MLILSLFIFKNQCIMEKGGMIVATKVEKRKVRKEQTAQALGIEVTEEPKKAPKGKKGFFKNRSENEIKWRLFFIEILLVIICLSYAANHS